MSSIIETKIKSIMKDDKYKFPLTMAMSSAWIMANYKAVNLTILDMQQETSLADYYVLCSVSNSQQAKAIAEMIMRQMRNFSHVPISTEGFNGSDWLLLDFGDIMIHIFLESSRPIYNLDTLWANTKKVSIPENYYIPSPELELDNDSSASKLNTEGYY